MAGMESRDHIRLKVVQQGRIDRDEVVFGERMLRSGKGALGNQGIEPLAGDLEVARQAAEWPLPFHFTVLAEARA